MSLQDILAQHGGAAAGIVLVALLSLIQISPVKINPWSFIGRLFKRGIRSVGKALTSDMEERITTRFDTMDGKMETFEARLDDIETKVIESSEEAREQAAVSARARILRFGDEILHKRRHSKDHFDSVLRDAAMYEKYCGEHKNFENGVTGPTIERIKEVYHERLVKNDFLGGFEDEE